MREISFGDRLSRIGTGVVLSSPLFPVVCSTIAVNIAEWQGGRYMADVGLRVACTVLHQARRAREPDDKGTDGALHRRVEKATEAMPLRCHRSTSRRGLSSSHRLLAAVSCPTGGREFAEDGGGIIDPVAFGMNGKTQKGGPKGHQRPRLGNFYAKGDDGSSVPSAWSIDTDGERKSGLPPSGPLRTPHPSPRKVRRDTCPSPGLLFAPSMRHFPQ